MNGAISACYAGLLGLLAVLLANNVLFVRLRAATQPKWKPDAALRVQANFVENVPLALVLLLLLELQGASVAALHAFGVGLVACRVLHAWGLGSYEGANYPRLVGAQGTFLLISIMSAALVYGALKS
ncbi:MAG: MAPEG family protein [Deltaproteobacteria bacterium]|nr:MAPEG family protein [Deltaproteobacteria bacterium]